MAPRDRRVMTVRHVYVCTWDVGKRARDWTSAGHPHEDVRSWERSGERAVKVARGLRTVCVSCAMRGHCTRRTIPQTLGSPSVDGAD